MTNQPLHIYDRPDTMNGSVRWTDTDRTRPVFEGDVAALERDLKNRVRGEVRFDTQAQAVYSTDSSNYRQVPLGAVLPLDKDDFVAAIETCRDHGTLPYRALRK